MTSGVLRVFPDPVLCPCFVLATCFDFLTLRLSDVLVSARARLFFDMFVSRRGRSDDRELQDLLVLFQTQAGFLRVKL
jgi:hypothetical protein